MRIKSRGIVFPTDISVGGSRLPLPAPLSDGSELESCTRHGHECCPSLDRPAVQLRNPQVERVVAATMSLSNSAVGSDSPLSITPLD